MRTSGEHVRGAKADLRGACLDTSKTVKKQTNKNSKTLFNRSAHTAGPGRGKWEEGILKWDVRWGMSDEGTKILNGGPKEASWGSEATFWPQCGPKAHQNGNLKSTLRHVLSQSRRANGLEEHFEVTFASLWGHCEVTLGSLRGQFGIWGWLWATLGSL